MPDRGIICISGGNGALGLVMGNWLLDKAPRGGWGLGWVAFGNSVSTK